MGAASRVRPKDFFTDAEWTLLSARSSWKGLALVAHCWAVIGAAMVMGVLWPITIPLAVMIVGTRQLGLRILMHDAAHGALHPNLKVNDWVAEYLCLGDVNAYRTYHLKHHKFAQQEEDPDLVLSAPFPISRNSLRRKIVRDLTGQTYIKERTGPLRARLRARVPGQPVLPILIDEIRRQRRVLFVNGIAFVVFAATGFWWVWPVLWLLPFMTWYMLVTRLRNIAEHALVAQNEPDPLRHARTTQAGFLERAFIAPYWVNYHCEHHMVMHMPCWSLPRAHEILAQNAVTARMETAPGYWAVLRAASAREPVAAGIHL
jgi:fatty acid desaturase